MMARVLFVTLALTLVMASFCYVKSDDSCFGLTAAFNYEKSVYLVDGDKYIQTDSSFNEIESGNMADKFNGPVGEVDAALIFPADNILYFFQGSNHFQYNAYWKKTGGIIANTDWGTFFEVGADAAGTLGSKSFFFKGCEYRTGEIGGKPSPTANLNIPCDVDAAWNANNQLYISKGNDVWIMDDKEKVSGPQKLSDLLKLTSASLCENQNPFTAKIEAEQKYEKDNNCVIIDAAVYFEDVVYLFNDNEYVSLDSQGNEAGKGDLSEWGLASNLDAGIVWPANQYIYYFKGPSYYDFDYSNTIGPLNSARFGRQFQTGIDAAGNRDGNSFFFKGCNVARYDGPDYKASAIHTTEELGVPCDVDAAFSSSSGSIYIIKRNQVWLGAADAQKATGPFPLDTVVKLTSWNVCSP